jgi:CRP/FNR family transcriptional regulator
MSKLDILQSVPLFSHLSEAERLELAGAMVETTYHKGEYIFREGDRAENFHIVTYGSVKCVKSSPEGKEVTLKVLMPGDLFCCEAAVFDGGTHPGCALPAGDVTVVRLPKQAYLDVLRRNPEAALDVIHYLGRRLNEAQESAKMLALERADQRLASLFVDLARRTGVREPAGIRLSVRLTRQDLANMAGLSTETVIRIISRFKRARLVSGTARSLTVKDLAGLRDIAAGRPRLRTKRPKLLAAAAGPSLTSTSPLIAIDRAVSRHFSKS